MTLPLHVPSGLAANANSGGSRNGLGLFSSTEGWIRIWAVVARNAVMSGDFCVAGGSFV
jgi:hypothetical protein